MPPTPTITPVSDQSVFVAALVMAGIGLLATLIMLAMHLAQAWRAWRRMEARTRRGGFAREMNRERATVLPREDGQSEATSASADGDLPLNILDTPAG